MDAALDSTAHQVRLLINLCVVAPHEQEPLVHKVEYVSIGRKDTMEELEQVDGNGAIVSVALRLGKVRLIDNIFI